MGPREGVPRVYRLLIPNIIAGCFGTVSLPDLSGVSPIWVLFTMVPGRTSRIKRFLEAELARPGLCSKACWLDTKGEEFVMRGGGS